MLRLVTALLILATLAGGVLYFQSDVFRTKANQVVDEWTKWTPENITRDPKGYLNFALEELNKIATDLKTHKRTLQERIDLAENRIKKEKLTVQASQRALDNLRSVYHGNQESFPVSYDSREYNATQFQDLVVETDRLLETALENTDRLELHITHLKGELARTELEMKRLVEKRQFVEQRLNHLKLDLAVSGANELTTRADEIAATAKALKPEPSKESEMALQLVKAEERKIEGEDNRTRFEKIMQSK